jgi:predicted Zn-dependent peptidase
MRALTAVRTLLAAAMAALAASSPAGCALCPPIAAGPAGAETSNAQANAAAGAAGPAAAAAAAAARRLLPASTDFTMPNGMRVLLVPDREVPLVSFRLRLAGGTCEDPAGKEGAAALLGTLLTKGAGDRDTVQFEEEVEFVGGSFSSGAWQRWLGVSCEFLKGDTELALELLGDVVLRPRLDPKEFEKERGLAVDGMADARNEPQAVIGRYASTWFFAQHPFGRPAAGDEVSVAALTLDDVKAAAARHLAPGRAWLAVAGDFDAAEMRRRIEARFGAWKAASSAPAELPAWNGDDGGRVLLVDSPESLQTYFWFGNRGFDWKDPDHAARWLANTILGGRFTSRLNRVLRTEKGLTYGANSWFDDDRQGLFVISTYTEVARSEECLTLAAELYRKFLAEGLTQEELDSARKYEKGQFGPSVETGSQQAAMLLSLDFDGVPRDVIAKAFERFDALTLEQVNRVIRERFPKKLDWVVIGPAEKLRPLAARFGTVTECAITGPGWGPRPQQQ